MTPVLFGVGQGKPPMTMMRDEAVGMAPETLPADHYFRSDIFDLEKEQIFYRNWNYVGHVSMFARPSTFLVREIADQSILVLRTAEDEFRAFYNVCQHRAHRLLEGEGALQQLIVCPYHTWAYDHEGRLQAARGAEEIPDFDKSTVCLSRVRLENFHGFLFVNLDNDAPSIDETTPGLSDEFGAFAPDASRLVVAKRYSLSLWANWKNSIENFCECYHCPNQHKTLTQNALDLQTYSIECHENFHVHRSRDKGEEMGYRVGSASNGKPNEFRSFYIWPNTVLEVYPGGNLTVFHHVPKGPEATEHVIEWYFKSAALSAEEQAVVDFVHDVRLEDVPLCESVQQGLHSKGYGDDGKGRLVIDAARTDVSEHALHHFQNKVRDALR